MCVLQVGRDPEKDTKLKALKEMSSYERADYVKKQGWATLPGDPEVDGRVAEQCAKLLVDTKS
jgi:hypothetical protein